MAKQVSRAFCEMCHSRCRVLVHTNDGRLVSFDEDRSFPMVDGIFPPTRACLKLRGCLEWMYDPTRVNYPLKRAGARGEGKWQRISWDQALDEIAAGLKAVKDSLGAESVAATNGTGRTHGQFLSRFLNLFGSPNMLGQGMICSAPGVTTDLLMFGWPLRRRVNLVMEADSTGYGGGATRSIFLLGMDPSQSNLRPWKIVHDAKKVGAKIILTDPRRTETAEMADIWLPLRPGTDTALLMAMINVVIAENLYDREFVEKWCHGFAEVRERTSEYTPERVAGITRLPAEQIREAARAFALNRPGVTIHGMGIEHLQDGIEALQAKNILSAILGNVDVRGGEYQPGPSKCLTEREMELSDKLSPEQKAKQLGTDRFKQISWPGNDLFEEARIWGKKAGRQRTVVNAHGPTVYRAMLTGKPYPVRAAITSASNPMVTQANTKLVYKALKSLDLYVVCDYWMTPSAELADYVLPMASWLERPFLSSGMSFDNFLYAGEQALPSAIPGEYDHRTDYDFFRGLGIRLGQEEYWPWETLEDAFDYQLSSIGTTFRAFMDKGGYDMPAREYKKYEKQGFATPTGKVELYSTILEKLGYDPLPSYRESFESPVGNPELAREYPLMLITGGRFQPMYHSEHRQVEYLRRRRPHPLAQIHPDTAQKLGIGSNDWVWIETPRGRIRMKCQLFDGIDPGVVHAEHGWWFPELPGEEPWLHGVWESNVNVLTEDDPEACNKRSGGWPLKTALCKVYKAKTY